MVVFPFVHLSLAIVLFLSIYIRILIISLVSPNSPYYCKLLRAFIIAIPQPPTKMRGLIIATRQDEENTIDVNCYINVRFHYRMCMSLIPLQATCYVYL
jgi:hypothetical protein